MGKIRIGCTLFSIGSLYIRGEMSFGDCVRTAAELGAEGYEIVATQMIPSYPFVSDEFIGEVERLSRAYGIRPICYAANMDRGMRADRDLTDDEMLAAAVRDVKNAHLLGCSIMREQYMMPPAAFVRLEPYAAAYGVKVGIEIHNPETPSTPAVQKYLAAYREHGTKNLGFVMDCGSFATRPNKPHWDKALAEGAKPELLEMAKQLRYDDVPLDEAVKRLTEAGANAPVFEALQGMYGFVQFRKRADLEGLKKIIPYIFEFHGKCHYVSEDLHEASIPYEEILPVIQASDFEGFIMTEYEGETDAVEMTRRHIAMEKKILAGIAKE